ncbi:MAG: D-aminopeptidase [Rhodobacteraceae bacterium]|jgi:D-aminopeptidase|nr:D-aminopeptidase [Paracoccaceae bacterium]
MIDTSAIDRAMDLLPQRFAGPGGVAAVMHQGRVVAARAWGLADLVSARPMTRQTRLPVCSITKQFTCAAVLAALGAPEALDARLSPRLPGLRGLRPTVRQLCHNQSGLRDYWAMTVLEGARAEQAFPRAAALPMLAAMQSVQFAPGLRHSYSNGNFRLLAEMLEEETGQPLEALFRRHLWDPAGMATAALAPDTRHPVDGVVGHEGSAQAGFMAAENGIWWQGDAGMVASLDDMLAWERWIDATREAADGLYRRLSAPVAFADGNPAGYGFGLGRDNVGGVAITGHGGALRGFRAYRLHAAVPRLSVVVMFNHEGAARDAARDLLRAALRLTPPVSAPVPPDRAGQWLCPETGLLARIEVEHGRARLQFATGAEDLRSEGGGLVSAETMLRVEAAGLVLERPRDNQRVTLAPAPPVATADAGEIGGRWLCPESGRAMEVILAGTAAFARFEGRLGTGRAEPAVPAGRDLWRIQTRRSMDAPAPGDWTLQICRDGAGRPIAARLGCWLARGIEYRRA